MIVHVFLVFFCDRLYNDCAFFFFVCVCDSLCNDSASFFCFCFVTACVMIVQGFLVTACVMTVHGLTRGI